MNKYILAVDIGGTKCAISIIDIVPEYPEIIDKVKFLTLDSAEHTLTSIFEAVDELTKKHYGKSIERIGISCGGPLDSKKGVIIAPPNLPGWLNVPIVHLFETRYNVSTSLENDANAGALAEWFWGAGKGKENLIFCTFGTGMGAGLILNGQLYQGTNSLAGEIGHIRLSEDGPIGFGKHGSVEGFCSGGGISRQGKMKATKWLTEDKKSDFCQTYNDIEGITAETIANAANKGDELAIDIFTTMTEKLGQTLSILIDILNPEIIILGSIYIRQEKLIKPQLMEKLHIESIPDSLKVCEVVPAHLHENIGDFAAAAIAKYAIEQTVSKK